MLTMQVSAEGKRAGSSHARDSGGGHRSYLLSRSKFSVEPFVVCQSDCFVIFSDLKSSGEGGGGQHQELSAPDEVRA
jgi:hypothetical protein